MAGQRRLHYGDGTSEEIDRQLVDVDVAVDETKKLIAKKLTGR